MGINEREFLFILVKPQFKRKVEAFGEIPKNNVKMFQKLFSTVLKQAHLSLNFQGMTDLVK